MELTKGPIIVTPFSQWLSESMKSGYLLPTINRCGTFLCLTGKLELEIDGDSRILKPNGLCFFVASSLMRVKSMAEGTTGILVEVDIDYILPISGKVMDVSDILFLREHPFITLTNKQSEYITRILEAYQAPISSSWLNTGNPKYRVLKTELTKSFAQVLFYELLAIYYSTHPSHPVQFTRKEAVFQKFVSDLFHYYQKERDVAFYAARQNLSARYFSAVVKETSGRSALQWIVQMVISDAKQLLENPELSIKEIAVRLNFCTQSFFGKYFKQYVGISPREYRKGISPTAETGKPMNGKKGKNIRNSFTEEAESMH